MKEFKLIKEYPGSPKKDFILDDTWKCEFTGNHGTYTLNTMNFNPKSYPEYWQEVKELSLLEEARLRYPIGTKFKSVQYDSGIKISNNNIHEETYMHLPIIYCDGTTIYYNDQWAEIIDDFVLPEKVVEKDYEILSVLLQRSDKHQIHNVSEYKNTGYIKALLNCNGNKIHSIKRLSDGEIFTIGDLVNNGIGIISNISKIYIHENKLIIDMNKGGWQYLHYIKKYQIKQPLFITEDGVDIFEGDNLYSIDNMLNIRKHLLFNARYDDNTLLNNRIFFNSDYKHFSTKEKAEEYILMNKPLLSLSDVWDNLKVKDQKEVMKFVKSKIK